jgi:hypothetical protein
MWKRITEYSSELNLKNFAVPVMLLWLAAYVNRVLPGDLHVISALVALAVVTGFSGSLSKVITSIWIYLISASAFTMVFHFVLPEHSPWYSNKLFLATTFIIFMVAMLTMWDVEISWVNDFYATVISILIIFSLCSTNLFRSGGAIAALFPSEDNAAWVGTTFVGSGQTQIKAGTFGPFIDLNLFSFHKVASAIFSHVTQSDKIAIGVVLFQIIFLASVPFIATTVLSWLGIARKGSSASLQILSLGLVFSAANFIISIGHLTAALALVCLAILGIIIVHVADGLKLTAAAASFIFLASLVVGETWFPIEPIALLLVLYVLYHCKANLNLSTIKNRLALGVGAICGLAMILPRFAFLAGVKGTTATDGASFLLTTTGGVAGIGPFTIEIVALITFVAVAICLTLKTSFNNYLILFVLFFAYDIVVRVATLLLTHGAVMYASRKLETFICLLVLTMSLWLLVRAFENSESNQLSARYVAVVALVPLLQIPSANTLIAKNGFSSIADAPTLTVSRSIASAAVAGTNLVCVTLDDAPYPTDKRYLAYKCSRFAAAYTNTDTVAASDYRNALLDRVGEADWPAVSSALPIETRVISVDPGQFKPSDLNSTHFRTLVNPKWTFFNASY